VKPDANTRLALKLGATALAMFGFGFALVPLYDVVCEITGINGRTGSISTGTAQAMQPDPDRLVTVAFDTNVNGGLPWNFAPAEPRMQVRPGELVETVFYAENTAAYAVSGQAVPSVVPAQAALYFSKTECFCFTRQTLASGERLPMPVRFIVDPRLPAGIRTLTLSYTFFEAPGDVARSAAAGNDINRI
jgi:cytochrome c oxidase assembly protein subunit 11